MGWVGTQTSYLTSLIPSQDWSFWLPYSSHLPNTTHRCQSVISGCLSPSLRRCCLAAQLGKMQQGVLPLAVPALVQFAGVWTVQSGLLRSHCIHIPTSPPTKFSFASLWLRPEFVTSTEVSWNRLLTRIDVDSPEDQVLGKGERSRRWLMEKEGS